MNIDPVLCGAWDGCHLWLQWNPVPDIEKPHPNANSGYLVMIAYGDKKRVYNPKRPWFHVPLHDAVGKEIRATVCGEIAHEVALLRPRCKFEWRAGDFPVKHPKGVTVARLVDGATCAFKLLEPVDLEPGENCITEMEAYQAGPWCQLDKPDHFVFDLEGGGSMRNTAPSAFDHELTGRDFTQLKAERPGPFLLVRS